MRPDTTTRDFRHHFDPNERVRLAEDLAHELIVKAESCRAFGAAKKVHDEALDTGEEVMVEPMTEDEKQEALPMEAA